MARQEIPMVINLRQNKNSSSNGYGKWYPEADSKEPLALKGFCRHMTEHGKLADYQMVVLVVQQVVECMKELICQGQPVKLEGLGTFSPSVESKTTPSGGGSEQGSGTGNGGSQGGNSGSQSGDQNQATSFALSITKSGSGTSTVKNDSEETINSGDSLESGANVYIAVTPAEGQIPSATLNGSNVSLTENDGEYVGTFQMPAQASTLVINSGSDAEEGD